MEEGEKEEKKEQRNERKPRDYVIVVKLAATESLCTVNTIGVCCVVE